jgi:pimeloyl-ACP methyl ester carboxylesterase
MNKIAIQIITILQLILYTGSAYAGWIDEITSEFYSEASAETNLAALVPTPPKDFGLPAHWNTYFLYEPIFKGNIFIAEVGSKLNPTLFLIHGLGQNGLADWLSVVPILEKKYHVILIDLPGFARSDQPKAKLNPTRYAEILHHIKPYFSQMPVIAVGHSMGGAVAMRYSFSYPNEVRKLLLVDVAGILQRTAFVKHTVTDRLPIDGLNWSNELFGFAARLEDAGTGLIEKLLNLPDPTTLLGKSDFAWGMALSKTPNINAALGLIEEDFSQAIYELPQPIAMLWGTRDTIAPLRTSKLLLENLQNTTLTFIEDAGHVPMVTHSHQFNRWIINALENVVSNRAEPLDSNESNLNQGDYHCEKSAGGIIEGRFEHLYISGCTGLTLQNIMAKDIVIKNSVVKIDNITLTNSSTSLAIENSTAIVTAAKFSGKLSVNQSRIDLAGIQFQTEKPFTVKTRSRLIISVSRTQFGTHTRYLHADMTIENTEF